MVAHVALVKEPELEAETEAVEPALVGEEETATEETTEDDK